MAGEKKEMNANQSMQLEKLLDMPFTVRLMLGTCTMEVGDIISLGQGAVIEFETPVSENLQLWVNDHPIAKASSVVVNERYGAKILEISPQEERLISMVDHD